MIKGVTKKEYDEIVSIISKYDGTFYAYGSRVKGDYTKASDLDVMVISNDYDNFISKLKEDFDKSHIPYIVNFVNKSNLSDDFYNLIKTDLILL